MIIHNSTSEEITLVPPAEIYPAGRPDLSLPLDVLEHIGSYLTEPLASGVLQSVTRPIHEGREIALDYTFNSIRRYHVDYPNPLRFDFAVVRLKEVFQTLWKKTDTRTPISFGAYKALLSQVEIMTRKDTILVWSLIANQAELAISKEAIIALYDSNPKEALGLWMKENQEDLASLKTLHLANNQLTVLPADIGNLFDLPALGSLIDIFFT